MAPEGVAFDPLGLLATLERERVGYVLVGALAGVLRGTVEAPAVVEVCPQVRPENLSRLEGALAAMDARAPDGDRQAGNGGGDVRNYTTRYGSLVINPQPPGTSGYDDLRRHATRERLSDQGPRALVASTGDLLRSLRARNSPDEVPSVRAYLRLLEMAADRERTRSVEL